MSKSTISTFELFQMFPDQESARLYLESRLWPDGVTCPTCRKGERITTRKGGYYRCNACQLDFTVRTGTIFERSHIPLHKWLYAMYLLVTARKGISSLQLAKEIGVTLGLCSNDYASSKIGLEMGEPTFQRNYAKPFCILKIDKTIQQASRPVAVGSVLCTDEHKAYSGIGGLFFAHETVNHSVELTDRICSH